MLPFLLVLPHVTPFSIPGSISSLSLVLCAWRCRSLNGKSKFGASLNTSMMYTSYSGTSFVRARRHLQPLAMTSTSDAPRRRCGCVSSVRGSACFFIYGVCSLQSLCLIGKLVNMALFVIGTHLGRRFSDII